MAFSLNRAQIIGNLTRDPEVRQIPTGQKVVTFSVATNFSWKDQTGTRKEKVEYHNIVAWRGLAEIAEKYLRRGRKVYVEGRLQTHEWEGEDGSKRNRTEIIADNLILLDKKTGEADNITPIPSEEINDTAQQKGSFKKTKRSEESKEESKEEEVNLDDLPF